MSASLYKQGRPRKKDPSSEPGEYRFTNKESGEIDYIGETNNLKRRKKQHDNQSIFSDVTHDFSYKVADKRFSTDSRREHERKK